MRRAQIQKNGAVVERQVYIAQRELVFSYIGASAMLDFILLVEIDVVKKLETQGTGTGQQLLDGMSEEIGCCSLCSFVCALLVVFAWHLIAGKDGIAYHDPAEFQRCWMNLFLLNVCSHGFIVHTKKDGLYHGKLFEFRCKSGTLATARL